MPEIARVAEVPHGVQRKRVALSRLLHRGILRSPERSLLSLLLFNFLQLALDRVAAITLDLGKAFSLLPGASLGRHSAIPATLIEIEILPAVAALPRAIRTLETLDHVTCEDRDRRRGGWRSGFCAESIARLQLSFKMTSLSNNMFVFSES